MSKKASIIIVSIIVIVSLAISIYIPNKEKLSNEKVDTSKNYEIIEEDGKLEAECHFCHTKYRFTKEEGIVRTLKN